MRRIASAALTVLMAFSLMLSLSTSVNANAIAGGGWSSSYSGESVFTNLGAGSTGQFSAIFFNDGTNNWGPGAVGLLICAADKTTCNVASPNAAYASGWFSSTVYATVSATVAPGQNGFFIYNFVVPAGTPAGTAATFNGDVGLIASGLELRPQGYFQINTTPSGTGGLTLSPTSASLPVGGTQQFAASGAGAGATITWSVTGGCGAVTNAGLFAATATNSATQPCSVNPTTTVANGSNTLVYTATLKDANGNTVSNASTPTLNFTNVTPAPGGTISSGWTNPVTPANGVASVTATTTTNAGAAQVSVSPTSGSATGCNAIATTTSPGASAKLSASFSPTPIAADGISKSTVTVKVQDSAGNTNINDGSTIVTATRDSTAANVCNITAVSAGGSGASATSGSAQAPAVAGSLSFTITSTTQPGSCLLAFTANPSTIAGTSASVPTQVVGASNKLIVTTNTSPAPAAVEGPNCSKQDRGNGTTTNAGCIYLVVQIQDANGLRVTGDSTSTITATLDANTCAGNSAGDAHVNNVPTAGTWTPVLTTNGTPTSTSIGSQGQVTFAFESRGAYSGCTVTVTGVTDAAHGTATLASTTATLVWTAGPADHLSCAFS